MTVSRLVAMAGQTTTVGRGSQPTRWLGADVYLHVPRQPLAELAGAELTIAEVTPHLEYS